MWPSWSRAITINPEYRAGDPPATEKHPKNESRIEDEDPMKLTSEEKKLTSEVSAEEIDAFFDEDGETPNDDS